MLIKSADDKTKRLKLLESLADSDRLDERQRDWLRAEYKRAQRGIAGERDAAHYLDRSFSDSKNHAILHDLRLEVDGQVAQIDHLVIGRANMYYLLETKTYSGSLHINEYGEFTVEYGEEKRYGIESPLEQSRRHETVLKKVIDRLGMRGRIGATPQFVHIVMVHPKATIHRPPAKAFDTSTIIKADQFATWHEQFVEKMKAPSVLGAVLQLRSAETIREWAEMLKAEHIAEDPLALPAFMRPKKAPTVPAAAPTVVAAPPPAPSAAAETCLTCGKALTPKAVKFCRDQAPRFKGGLYCFVHQAAHPVTKRTAN